MPTWYIGLWSAYCLPLIFWASAFAPEPHEVIHVDFKRREIVRVAS